MVLVIDKSKRQRDTITEMFYYMGILAYGAAPMPALSEVSKRYSAVLISSLVGVPDAEDYISKLRSYSDLPIFGLSEEYNPLFDRCFNPNIYSSTLATTIAAYLEERGERPIGIYRLAGIEASADEPRATYFDHDLGFTKTETMILRYLIKVYPAPAPAKDILKYAFRATRRPEAASVRTHISVMNKKFSRLVGVPLTFPSAEVGYIIATPELRQQRKEAVLV